jgi:biotin-dependent carboxylase-like uncharacterized protein
MNGLLVERSTPLIQLQDRGRFGIRHLGVTQGGALDWVSMSWANWLVGNALDAAVVEITLGGLSLLVEHDGCLALAGADLDARLNGEPVQPWRSFHVQQGQRLVFGQPQQGARAYLAVSGGFNAPLVLGSRATTAREELGGLQGEGQPLAAGDRLTWNGGTPLLRHMSPEQIPNLTSQQPLQLLLGAQIADFSGQSLFDLFNSPWQIDPRADRMGVRLNGPALEYQGQPMISEGIPLGAIQVPPDGQPIVLLNDRQTIGGYPRVGALMPESVARLGQLLPGAVIRLTPVVQGRVEQAHVHLLNQWEALSATVVF